MKNIEKLFDTNIEREFEHSKLKVKKRDNELIFQLKLQALSGFEISHMIHEIASGKYPRISFKFEKITFADGLVPAFLDCIVYYLVKNKVNIRFDLTVIADGDKITEVDSYIISAINQYQQKYYKTFTKSGGGYYQSKKCGKKIKEDFVRVFEEEKLTQKGFVRLFINRNKMVDYEDYVFTEIKNIFDFHNIDEELFLDITEILYEIIENVKEKTDGEIIIAFYINDIIFTSSKEKTKMLESTIISFQSSTISDEIKNFYERLSNENISSLELSTEYYALLNHYKIQKGYFDNRYTEKHFLTLAAFNNRVTSRERAFGKKGGTGLPTLIDRVKTNEADTGNSYVYSGEQIIQFRKGLLELKDDLVTFNIEKNPFLKPNVEEVIDNGTYIPGVAYNLVFPI